MITPPVNVAAGKFVVPIVSDRLVDVIVTVIGTLVSGKVPSPMSMVAVPEKVRIPTALEPLLAVPSTSMFCGRPRVDVPNNVA